MSGAFPIAAVAKLTGLSVDTLRAWERRYGAVTPRRDAGGVRRYNEEDVERLRLLRSATSMGNAIRHVAKLHDDQVRALVQGTTEASPDATGPIVERIVQSIRRYDAWHAEELLTRAAMLLDSQRFVIGVLSPLMSTVGALWEGRALSIAQEHLVSVLVRNLLGALMRQRPPATSGITLFATPPGESHEFGIVLAASLASMRGIRVSVLGSGLPSAEILRAARYLRPTAIVIGAMLAQPEVQRCVAAVRAKTPVRTKILLGGPVAVRQSVSVPGVDHVATLSEFADRLPQYAA